MRSTAVLGVCAILLTSACTTTGAAPGSEPRPDDSSITRDASSDADIYGAVLRRFMEPPVERTGPGIESPWVYVLDRTDERAADPMRTISLPGGPAISAADQKRIATALRNIGPILFIRSRSEVVVRGGHGCEQVNGGEILILLGPPIGGPDQVRVGINGFISCHGAAWLTYVVTRGVQGWTVTGTARPVPTS